MHSDALFGAALYTGIAAATVLFFADSYHFFKSRCLKRLRTLVIYTRSFSLQPIKYITHPAARNDVVHTVKKRTMGVCIVQ